jgi:NAD(P)-dependent dehydrogenase (short-subunit alcohol dehydrogenase family)
MIEANTRRDKTILVTGATGNQGGTGRSVAKLLLERGLPVRALVRTLDDRAEALRKLGAEIAVGDFGNYKSLLAALKESNLPISAIRWLPVLQKLLASSRELDETKDSSASSTYRWRRQELTVRVHKEKHSG